MSKTHFLFVILLILPSFVQKDNSPKLVRKTITRTISALMPEEFRPMTDQEIARKYFSYRKPLVMLTNQDQTVDFGFNVSATTWEYKDLALLQKFYKSTIQNIYTNIAMVQEGIKEINGQNYIVFEFVSEVKSDKNSPLQQSKKAYSYLLYTIVEDEVYIFNFTSPAHVRSYWSPVAEQMMKSIKL
jgi:hypothetical protein